jgi:hypothetical protein
MEQAKRYATSAAVACSFPQGLAMQPADSSRSSTFLIVIPLAYLSSFALPALSDLPGSGAFALGLPCCVAAPFGFLSASAAGNGSGSQDLLECLSYLAWAANPLAWIGYGSLAGGGFRKARGFGICALILALSFGGIALSRDSVHWTLGPGYWL